MSRPSGDEWLLGLLAVVSVVLALWWLSGCAVAEKQGGVVFEDFNQRFDDLYAALVRIGGVVTASGNARINEPWTARILAIGQVLSGPLTILLYLIAHRWPIMEQVCDTLKGKPRQRRTRATDKEA